VTNDKLVEELRHCGEALIKVADALCKKTQEPTKEAVTFEEVRGALALKIQNGNSEQVRALLEKYGGAKLSDIDASKYEALMKDVEEI